MRKYAIEKPCHENWEAMSGTERVRFCALCQRQVHDFSAMTRKEVERLTDSAKGRVCGRVSFVAEGVPQFRAERPGAAGQFVRMSLLGLAGFSTAAAATDTCQVKVVATDVTGEGLSKARVRIVKEGKTIEQSSASDAGIYLTSLPAGSYSIEVDSPGFERFTNHLSCAGGDRLQVDAQLRIGALMGQVVVVAPNHGILYRIAQRIKHG